MKFLKRLTNTKKQKYNELYSMDEVKQKVISEVMIQMHLFR